jgi:hypothetical protein
MIDELINKILKTHYNLDVQKLNGKDITFDKKRDKIRNKFNNSNIFIAPLKQSIEQQILNIGRAAIATNEEFSISIDENQEDGIMKNSVRMNTPVNNNSSNNTEVQVFILEWF